MKKLLIIPTITSIFFSCGSKTTADKAVEKKDCLSSYEVIAGDTANVTDCDGKRQGKWIRNKYVPSKDTIWNNGDTLYFKDNILLK